MLSLNHFRHDTYDASSAQPDSVHSMHFEIVSSRESLSDLAGYRNAILNASADRIAELRARTASPSPTISYVAPPAPNLDFVKPIQPESARPSAQPEILDPQLAYAMHDGRPYEERGTVIADRRTDVVRAIDDRLSTPVDMPLEPTTRETALASDEVSMAGAEASDADAYIAALVGNVYSIHDEQDRQAAAERQSQLNRGDGELAA